MGPPYTRGPQLPQDSVQSLLYRTANTSTGLELVQRKTPEGPFVVSSLWVAPSAARSVAPPPPPRGCATQVQIAPSRCQLWGGGDGGEGSSGQRVPALCGFPPTSAGAMCGGLCGYRSNAGPTVVPLPHRVPF